MSHEKMVYLTLTQDEAFTLRRVLDNVGGSQYKSQRKYTEVIVQQLNSQNVPYPTYDNKEDDALKGEIYFDDEARFETNGNNNEAGKQ